jgi:thiamine-phosphate pyrophosphorylase
MSEKAPPRLGPLYAIVDAGLSGAAALPRLVAALGRAGVRAFQLRAKELPPRELLPLARELRSITRALEALLIVNDRADIALAADADGVHLGQEDLPLAAARRLMGRKLVGLSTHDLAQAVAAEREGADYIGFGPVFATKTKETGYGERGLEMLGRVRAAVSLPIVAIGGITEENVRGVWRAGADAAAMISELANAPDPEAKARRILSLHPA